MRRWRRTSTRWRQPPSGPLWRAVPTEPPPPGRADWRRHLGHSVVALVLIALVGAALLLWPHLRRHERVGPGRSCWLSSAGAWLATAIAIGVAIRGRQLVDADPETLPEMLMRLPGPDGDTRFYGLLILSVVVLVGLPAVLLTLATYLSSSPDQVDLRLVRGTLAAEVAFGVLAVGSYASGLSRVWPVTVLAVNAVASAVRSVAMAPVSWRERRPARRRCRNRPRLARHRSCAPAARVGHAADLVTLVVALVVGVLLTIAVSDQHFLAGETACWRR